MTNQTYENELDENNENEEYEEYEFGQLLINQNAIFDGQIQRTNLISVGHTIAPFLFHDNMTAVEAHRVLQNTILIETIRQQSFITEMRTYTFDATVLTANLFTEEGEQIRTIIPPITQINYFHVPLWIPVVSGITIFPLLIILAAIMGKKMSKIIHKNQDEKDEKLMED